MIYDLIIIGAGASGLFAAARLPRGLNALVLERSEGVGTKLLVTGGGACNLTHEGSIKEFLPCYYEKGKKIRSILYKYNNEDMKRFFEEDLGVSLVTREDGKVFPRSMDAHDVRDSLLRRIRDKGIKIETNTEVVDILPNSDAKDSQTANKDVRDSHIMVRALCEGKRRNLLTRKLVIATGGRSYPHTGSDGSLMPVIEKLPGVTIIPQKPALGPITVRDYPYSELKGISFSNIGVDLFRDGRKVAGEEGDLIFTDSAFSGPVIMQLSRYAEQGDELRIDYVGVSDPGTWRKSINARLSRSKQSIVNAVSSELELPKRFVCLVNEGCEGSVSKLTRRLTEDTFVVNSPGSFKNSMVTRGGISLSSINKNMELKSSPGIYVVGEVVDVDGKTGGYNLQFAYASSAKAVDSMEF